MTYHCGSATVDALSSDLSVSVFDRVLDSKKRMFDNDSILKCGIHSGNRTHPTKRQ